MIYKYCSVDRFQIFESGLIRFTQPGDFNDPFELNPSFDLMSKADISRLPLAPVQNGNSSNQAHLLTPEVLADLFNSLRFGIARTINATVKGEGYFLLDNNQIAKSVFDSKFGILCLTESPDNLLMWAHYADCHRGFAIQFDETHEFFSTQIFEGQEFSLSPIIYSNERPVLSYSTLNSPLVFYRKSIAWEYEREWRLIRPLINATKVLDHPTFPRALFSIPSEAIKGIIIGVSMTQENRDTIFNILMKPELKHIKIFQVHLSKDHYSIEIYPRIDGSVDPDAGKGIICEAR